MDVSAVKVALEPKVISPPPDNPVPAVIVILEEANAAMGILDKVLDDPEIVLLVKVLVVSIPTRVVVASGKVKVLAVVGLKLIVDPANFKEERLSEVKVGVEVVDRS